VSKPGRCAPGFARSGDEVRRISLGSGCNRGRGPLFESSRLGVAHPYFAPTILDGGVTKFTTGEIAKQVSVKHLDGISTFSIGAPVVAEQLDLQKGSSSIIVLL